MFLFITQEFPDWDEVTAHDNGTRATAGHGFWYPYNIIRYTGWEEIPQYCDLTIWQEDGWYITG